jgi:hypothetical protein
MSERVTLTRQEALALRRLRAEVDRASRRSAEVPTTEKPEAPDVTNFIQFRRKLIQFLNLPPDVSESALRKVLERSSSHLYKNYLTRTWDE